MNNNEKLTICYNAWMIYSKNDDYDKVVGEVAKRGFNCIRVDDGAGLYRDENGSLRKDILISAPFGKYTEYTAYLVIVDNEKINILDRFLRLCVAAKIHNVKLILSSWFFLHTNWFCQEKDIEHLFELSNEEKIKYFADETIWILDVLKKHNLLDVVAFVELFNEFDNIPWHRNDIKLTSEEATELRIIHEREIDRLKKVYPEILVAFDTKDAVPMEEIVPRNIDVFNFHSYYAWDVYNAFEKSLCFGVVTLDEPEIPEETKFFLKKDIISVKSVANEMNGTVKTGPDWPRRMALYASIDWTKEKELNKLLEDSLKEKMENYKNIFHNDIQKMLELHKKIVPNSKIVMGEGLTYCCSPKLTFERDSKCFWDLIKEQVMFLKEKGIWGTVLVTTHAPGRCSAWSDCIELYSEANKLFLNSEENKQM